MQKTQILGVLSPSPDHIEPEPKKY